MSCDFDFPLVNKNLLIPTLKILNIIIIIIMYFKIITGIFLQILFYIKKLGPKSTKD